ncbi:zinc finger protein 346-like [Pyrus ussuriensis x Pyrus communis]|uniref:Zinc finger protein 346-like n=1 Tax=Pyrus ussuriensis x Pyrus communis TaxID=2448454 RepID=A0A5N5G6T0_9ROSA|nr:zinc finger protein 346-like [Pyrus ussuriensis x Pyrus communis]
MIIPPDSNFPSGSQSSIFIPPQYSNNFTFQIPYESNPTNPIWSFPQPVVPSAVAAADPACHPPGTDPYDYSGLYPWTRVGFQGQTPFGEDPNIRPQNWVAKQAEPVRYEASFTSLNECMSVPATASNSLWNSSWTNQPLENTANMNTPQPTVVVQSLRCDVCDIYCTSKPIYETHIAGKKHQKKVAMQHNPGVTAGSELETKRRKILRGGSTVDSVRVCTICNITCNSEEVYNKHLYGKRHKAQASLMALDGGPYIAAVGSQFNGIWKKDPNKVKLVQSAWCEVCKINCNSNDAYIAHLVGKKHKKNLEQLGKSKNDGSVAATNAIIGTTKNPEAESSKAYQLQVPKEDLETKKKKVISGGAIASAVRTCTVCNVVCNSQTVFSSHLAGQKHVAMVKKQAEAEVATTGLLLRPKTQNSALK